MNKEQQFVQTIQNQLMQWRRWFHQHPELGFMEYYTTYTIGKELEALGFTLHIGQGAIASSSRYGVPAAHLLQQQEEKAASLGVESDWMNLMKGGHTGLVATWDTGKEGEHKAFRFDIDALPIHETESEAHLPYSEGFISSNPGVMHACGHDGHITIGLGLAHYIAAHHSELTGSFTFLFQPAEEGGRGAKAMVDNGWLTDVDSFYTGHLGITPMNIGTIAAGVEGFLASTKLNVHFKGESSHAGMKPEDGRNALLAAATASTQLYTIPRHSEGASRVNVGKLEAGNGRNIISDTGYLELETRGVTGTINDYMLQEAKRIIHASASMYNVEATIEFVGESEGIVCDEDMLASIPPEEDSYINQILPSAKVSGSEDASFMINEVQAHGGKATYMLFGTALPFNHHHPSFDFEEDALSVALETYIHLLQGGTTT
ncbi:amidohydrolase [Pontibacillus yanchengensis]|uniref:Peptidase M20 n=1 Tax=Pontibacillus yanchengensis Y32 TaxID=1385514 RepID=A0A0A2TE35_9BACI|nr:peptidase M20 [Pontibacillus yanchengensis Y32]